MARNDENFPIHSIQKFIATQKNDENFPIQKFLMSEDFLKLDWEKIIQIEKMDANLAFNNFYSAIEPIIDKYTPLEKVKNKGHKRRYKPWITNGIINSMRRRDKLLHQYIKMKDPTRKSSLYTEYKLIRNRIVELTKSSKQIYFQSYFASNNKNVRKMWQGINGIINVKAKYNDIPTCITEKDKHITNPKDI